MEHKNFQRLQECISLKYVLQWLYQKYSQQAARVFVDGQEVTEHSWYVADSNPYKRWLEDDFDIPARFTSGKSSVSIRIIPINKENEDKRNWNEAGYQIFSYIK